MLRAVLAVLVATALWGVAAAALDDARTTRTAQELDGQLTRIAGVAADLRAADDAVAPDGNGARRVLTLRVPGREFADARVEAVEIGAGADGSVFAYELANGRGREFRRDVPLRAASRRNGTLSGESRSLVLRRPGTYRLVLELVRVDGRPTVVVRHAQV